MENPAEKQLSPFGFAQHYAAQRMHVSLSRKLKRSRRQPTQDLATPELIHATT